MGATILHLSLSNGFDRVLLIFALLATGLVLVGCGASATSSVPASTRPSPPEQTAANSPISPAAATPPGPTETSPRESTPALTLTASPTPSSSPTPVRPIATDNAMPTVRSVITATAVSSATKASGALLEPSLCLCDGSCPCDIEHVVIISIDGLRPDALEQADTPVLDTLRAAGTYSPAAQAVLPSVTLVNHASMLGGMTPEKHGIFWNMNDPALGKVKGPTLFSEAHAAGFSTAMVVGKPKLEHLMLPGSVDDYRYAGFTDRQVVNEALAVIRAGLPNILFVHLPDVDSAGHAVGWMSQLQLIAVSRTDSLIGELIAALEAGDYLSRTLVVVTSDHGGSGRAHGSDSPEDITIPWLAVGPGVPAGVILERDDLMIYDTAATVLRAFSLPIPEAWAGRPVEEIFGETVLEK